MKYELEVKDILSKLTSTEIELQDAIEKILEFVKLSENPSLINTQDEESKMSILHWAAAFRNVNAIIDLVYHNANPQLSDKYGRDLFESLGTTNIEEELIGFIRGTSDLTELNKILFTLISLTDNSEIVKNLIDKGVSVNVLNETGNSPLIHAILNARPETAEFLLSQKDVDLSITDKYGTPALFLAARLDMSGILKKMLKTDKTNVDINIKTSTGKTALMESIDFGCSNSSLVLIEKGINLDEQSIDGKTALSLAIENNLYVVVESLLKNGVTIANLTEDQTAKLTHFSRGFKGTTLEEKQKILMLKNIQTNLEKKFPSKILPIRNVFRDFHENIQNLSVKDLFLSLDVLKSRVNMRSLDLDKQNPHIVKMFALFKECRKSAKPAHGLDK